tara:strand:- start:112 stop:852 length:741 start_codon:yes stop_codon:yes gene_type:complete
MQIDLNADLGEGAAHDRELLAIVSSANISCGAHAGDADTIANAIRLARAHGVRIGAHPSFPDRENFGRKAMQLPIPSLRNHLLYQLHALRGMVHAQGARFTHIKPHGALYNQAATDSKLAEELALILQEFDPQLAVVGLAGSQLLRCVRQLGMSAIAEGFADRRYAADGTLLPRSDALALIHDPQQAVAQCLEMICEGKVMTVAGQRIDMRVDTVCLHGDTPEALVFAQSLVSALSEAGVTITRAL